MAVFAPVRLFPSTKRVVLADVKKVGGSHCWNRCVQNLAAKGRHRRGDRRFQPGGIANAFRPAIQLDLLRVDLQHFVQRQEERVHAADYSASLLNALP